MKSLFNIISMISFFWLSELTVCQIVEQWRAIYAGPGNGDFLRSMCLDSSGNVYVTGNSRNTINSADYATVKYSTAGIQQWAARYIAVPNMGAIAYSITADKFGNAYVTGFAPLGINGPSKYTTVKYNQAGAQVWVKIYYGEFYPAANVSYSITIDSHENIYVTGESVFAYTGYDYTTVKYDSAGTELWVARYENQGLDAANQVVVDNFTNVYVTGYCLGDTTHNDIVTVKYNSSGIQQWAARYNGPGNRGDSATDLKVDTHGNAYVCGASYGGSTTGYDFITIKYDENGVQQWSARYNGGGINLTDYAQSLAIDDSGNVYVTGYVISPPNNLNCGTIKYNSAGIQQWIKIYDYDGGPDWGVSLVLDKQSNIYISAASAEVIRIHFATIKYSPAGEQLWVVRTYSLNGETPSAIAVDTIGNVYVAGSDGHYLTIKYNQIVGVDPVSNEIPAEFRLYQNYPNPFNPVTEIRFDVPAKSNVELRVYDVLGRLVKELVNEYKSAGNYTVIFDGTNLSSGIYFYRVEAANYISVKKMLLKK